MKTLRHIACSLALGCLVLSQSVLNAADAKDENWVTLFNGKDLTGWVGVHDVTFEVKEGNLQLVKGMGWLRSEKEYKDFNLEFEWRALVDNYDSGVFIRCIKDGKPWPTDGWQVNLAQARLGGLVRGYSSIVPAEAEKIKPNVWVKMRIEVRGKKCVLYVNGEKNWEFDKLDKDKGFIGIQAENKAFDFRNIRIQELPEETKAK